MPSAEEIPITMPSGIRLTPAAAPILLALLRRADDAGDHHALVGAGSGGRHAA